MCTAVFCLSWLKTSEYDVIGLDSLLLRPRRLRSTQVVVSWSRAPKTDSNLLSESCDAVSMSEVIELFGDDTWAFGECCWVPRPGCQICHYSERREFGRTDHRLAFESVAP